MNLQNQLEKILQDLQLVLTETSLILGAICLLIIGLIFKQEIVHKIIFVFVLIIALYFNIGLQSTGLILSDSLILSKQSITLSSLLLLTTALALLYPRYQKMSAEFYFFLLSLCIGSIFM
ncbi:MAG: hypothetical protein AAFY41_09100, partial [Bacteroidota bacterium]